VNGNQPGTFGFVGKFLPSGDHVWSRTCGAHGASDPSNSFARTSAMSIDSNGDTIVSGVWNYQADFGGGMRFGTATSWLMFTVKYSGVDGRWVWDATTTGNTDITPAWTVADTQNNIIVAGYFHGAVGFGINSFTSQGGSDCFVSKYSGAGNPVWAKSFGGASDDNANSVVVDSGGNPVVTGAFQSATGTFAGQLLTNAGGVDCFLMKLNP